MSSKKNRAHEADKALKNAVGDRDGWRCVYCGERGLFIDHVVPLSKGGPSIRANLVTSCDRCNHKKYARVDLDLTTRAFYHLLTKGESLGWLDKLQAGHQ